MHMAFLHSAKISETGRLLINGVPHFTMSLTCIGKPRATASGPRTYVHHLAAPTRKEVRSWKKCLGSSILKIANLPSVEPRVKKASRHKVNRDWKSKHLVITGENKDNYSRRKPSFEAENLRKEDSRSLDVAPIAVPSITLHPFHHKWKLGNNNFTKTPARPKTKTAAETIPDYIIKAVFKNDIDEIIVWLSTHRAFDDMEARSGDKMLHSACSVGNVSLATFFLDKGASLDVKDGYGESPLYTAVRCRKRMIIELLLKRGANVNDGADDGVTPLALACANGDVQCVKLLLESGANPMKPDIRGITPFFTACAQGNMDIVKVRMTW